MDKKDFKIGIVSDYLKPAAYEEARKLILGFFEGDEKKTQLWFETPNTFFGSISPDKMFILGKGDRVLDWIKVALKENESPLTEEEKIVFEGESRKFMGFYKKYKQLTKEEQDMMHCALRSSVKILD